MGPWLKRILQLLGLVVLFFFARSIDSSAFRALKLINLGSVLLILLLVLLNVATKALRWKILVREMNDANISFFFSLKSILAGVSAGSLIPGRMEMAKPILLKINHGVTLSRSAATLFAERIFDFIGLFVIMLISTLFVQLEGLPKVWIVGPIALICYLMWMVFFPSPAERLLGWFLNKFGYFFSPKWRRKLEESLQKFFTSFARIRKKGFFAPMLILSLLAHFFEILRFVFILKTFGLSATLAVVGFTFAATVFISIVSMVPGGLGITEVSAWAILSRMLNTTQYIEIGILIDRIFSFYLLSLLGLIYLVKPYWARSKEHK